MVSDLFFSSLFLLGLACADIRPDEKEIKDKVQKNKKNSFEAEQMKRLQALGYAPVESHSASSTCSSSSTSSNNSHAAETATMELYKTAWKGTAAWMAPEVMGNEYGAEVDVFSFGMVSVSGYLFALYHSFCDD